MKRHPVLAGFSRDHHQALITAQYIKKGAPSFKGMPVSLSGKLDYALTFFRTHLLEHFRKEEEILFTLVRKWRPEMDALVVELIAEHRAMEALIPKIENNIDTEIFLDELGHLLESHIRKEERILFQKMQEKLSDADFLTLENLLS